MKHRPGQRRRGCGRVAIAQVEAIECPARGTPFGSSYPVAKTR